MVADSPETTPDRWQVQIQARIQLAARVLVKADGLGDDELRAAHLEPIHDVSETIARFARDHPEARVCVLPQGPQTIPYLS
jgi:hypothetical protein